MKHSNIFNTATSMIWGSTESQMQQIVSVLNAVDTQEAVALRKAFEEDRHLYARTAFGEDLTNIRTGSGRVRVSGGVAIVPIEGVIMPKANLFMAISGGTSAELLEGAIKTLTATESIHTIVLDIDSNGGSVAGLSTATAAIRKARETKRVYSIARDSMNSAAYWLGSAAEKVFVTPTSVIGSIGVLMTLSTDHRRATENGIDREIIRSTPLKAKPNTMEPLDEEGRSKAQEMVDEIHDLFVKEVAANRKISINQSSKMANGTVKQGESAIEAGLADGVSDLDTIVEGANAAENDATQIETLLQANADMSAELAETKAALSEATKLLADSKVNSAVASAKAQIADAVSNGSMSAAKATELTASLEAGTIEASVVEQVIGLLEPGTATPEGHAIDEESASVDEDPFAPKTDYERKIYAQDSKLRKRYNL